MSIREIIIDGIGLVASIIAISAGWSYDRPAWLSDLASIAESEAIDIEDRAVRNRIFKGEIEFKVEEQGGPPTPTQGKLMGDLDLAYDEELRRLGEMRELKNK